MLAHVLTLDPFRLDDVDTYSNILYVKDSRKELSLLAHSANRTEPHRAETCCVVGKDNRGINSQLIVG